MMFLRSQADVQRRKHSKDIGLNGSHQQLNEIDEQNNHRTAKPLENTLKYKY